MNEYIEGLKRAWLWMAEPPWRHSGMEYTRGEHWLVWLMGWAWVLTGLVLGALAATSLVRFVGLSNSPYQDWLVICVAVLAGFLVQFLGWCLVVLVTTLADTPWLPVVIELLLVGASLLLPLAGVIYGIYRYLTWVGPDQRSFGIAFVGGLFCKTLLIPAAKAAATGALLKLFRHLMDWLRGDKVKTKGA